MLAKIGLLAAHGSRPITGRKNGQHEPRAGHTMENQGLLQRPVSTTASWIKLFFKLWSVLRVRDSGRTTGGRQCSPH